MPSYVSVASEKKQNVFTKILRKVNPVHEAPIPHPNRRTGSSSGKKTLENYMKNNRRSSGQLEKSPLLGNQRAEQVYRMV